MDTTIVTARIESPVGRLTVCATAQAVCLLEFGARRVLEAQLRALRKQFGCAIVPGENKHVKRLKTELSRYFAGKLRKFTVPVVHPGTVFQEAVWRRLLKIPYGETASYEQVAVDIGRPGAQRAVGLANGKNRIAIVIPCHRVVKKNGEVGGYGGGVWRKEFLLKLERRETGSSRGR